jgi:hypothetical protein
VPLYTYNLSTQSRSSQARIVQSRSLHARESQRERERAYGDIRNIERPRYGHPINNTRLEPKRNSRPGFGHGGREIRDAGDY